MNAKINFQELYELAFKLAKEPPFTADNLYVDFLLTLALEEVQSEFDFVLKGGTAIVKAWLEPYRFSYDLDFSYFGSGDPRKHYREYRERLEEKLAAIGFVINEGQQDAYRSGGRIFILRLMDKPKHLKRPVKLSVSTIDETACFPVVERPFKTLGRASGNGFELLYPDLIPRLANVEATVLAIEELCAEKIRALSTRGTEKGWSLVPRDVFDLYMMDKAGILDKVLSKEEGKKCIRNKFSAIKGTVGYWSKFTDFMAKARPVKLREEDRAIFFKPGLLNEKKATETIEKIQTALKQIIAPN